MFNIEKAHYILEEMVQNGYIVESNRSIILGKNPKIFEVREMGFEGGRTIVCFGQNQGLSLKNGDGLPKKKWKKNNGKSWFFFCYGLIYLNEIFGKKLHSVFIDQLGQIILVQDSSFMDVELFEESLVIWDVPPEQFLPHDLGVVLILDDFRQQPLQHRQQHRVRLNRIKREKRKVHLHGRSGWASYHQRPSLKTHFFCFCNRFANLIC
jgi:hypothetical protein